MNTELRELYEKNWSKLIHAIDSLDVKAANPLLIKVHEDYVQSDVKVMIVGQETDGWFGELNQKERNIDDLMTGYFNYFYQKTDSGKRRGKRAFWNKKNYKYFEDDISRYFRKRNLKVAFLWNNISKIGNIGSGKPKKEIRALERNYFNVLKNEFNILKPDIVLFTTGSSRDSFIKHHFGSDVKFSPKLCLINNTQSQDTLNLIAEVSFPEFDNICSVRIEHPNRRTLNNSITASVIKEIWEHQVTT